MARKVIVLALLLVAFVGMASAAEAPISDDVIGTDDGSVAGAPSIDGSVAGPLSNSPVAGGDGTGAGEAAAGPDGAEAPSQSDGSALKVSAIAGVAAVAGYFF